MLLAHKIEVRPTPEQAEYLNRACGARRHCFNQLLAHFQQEGVKWSKAAAYQHYMSVLRIEFPWYLETSARVTRNAIDDLDSAFQHFFQRIKLGQKPGFPRFKKKGINDSFALRESGKFAVNGRDLRIEKLKTPLKLRQKLRFTGATKQVTISKQAVKFYASILVETEDYNPHAPADAIVGVDLGIKALAVLSTGEIVPANQKLKNNIKKLRRLSRNLSRKTNGSNRRAKAKLKVAKLHARVANQRQSVIHELSDKLTREFKTIVIEDLHVKGMVKNHKLARAVSDAGMGMLRQAIEYKSQLRGVQVILADRWFPSSKTCSACGQLHAMPLSQRVMVCDCGNVMDRDVNAAKNLEQYGRLALLGDLKRTQELSKTSSLASALTA